MHFRYSKEGNFGRITMAESPYGAMTDPVFTDLAELLDFFADSSLKAVTLCGAGRHFCSGADRKSLGEICQDSDGLFRSLTQAKELLDILRFAPVPVVAVISGSCLGGGLELALACHFRFAAAGAMFGFPETGLQLMPGMGGTVISQNHISKGKLIELTLSSRMIGAEEALQIGLIDHVSPTKNIRRDADDFLHTLTSQHPVSLIRTVMQSIHNGSRMKVEDALAEETRLFCQLATVVGGRQE